jgi:hypothetical protein
MKMARCARKRAFSCCRFALEPYALCRQSCVPEKLRDQTRHDSHQDGSDDQNTRLMLIGVNSSLSGGSLRCRADACGLVVAY